MPSSTAGKRHVMWNDTTEDSHTSVTAKEEHVLLPFLLALRSIDQQCSTHSSGCYLVYVLFECWLLYTIIVRTIHYYLYSDSYITIRGWSWQGKHWLSHIATGTIIGHSQGQQQRALALRVQRESATWAYMSSLCLAHRGQWQLIVDLTQKYAK